MLLFSYDNCIWLFYRQFILRAGSLEDYDSLCGVVFPSKHSLRVLNGNIICSLLRAGNVNGVWEIMSTKTN